MKGSFDGWTAEWTLEAMGVAGDGEDNGMKALTLRLRPGTYLYKFKVDGEWCLDDGQDKHTDNGGVTNNCVRVN